MTSILDLILRWSGSWNPRIYSLLLIYYKGCFKGYKWTARWKHTGRGLDGLHTQEGYPMELGCAILPIHRCVHQPRNSPNLTLFMTASSCRREHQFHILSWWGLWNSQLDQVLKARVNHATPEIPTGHVGHPHLLFSRLVVSSSGPVDCAHQAPLSGVVCCTQLSPRSSATKETRLQSRLCLTVLLNLCNSWLFRGRTKGYSV